MQSVGHNPQRVGGDTMTAAVAKPPKTVYVLGAGFSRDANVPLQNEILDRLGSRAIAEPALRRILKSLTSQGVVPNLNNSPRFRLDFHNSWIDNRLCHFVESATTGCRLASTHQWGPWKWLDMSRSKFTFVAVPGAT